MGCFAIFFPPVISTMPFNLCIESLKCSIARNLVKMGMHRLACVGMVWCADENWWVNWNWINHASNFVHGVFAIIFVIVVAIYMRPGMWQMYCTTVRNGLHEMCAISLETGDTVQISRDKYAEVVDYLKWDSAAVTSTAPPPPLQTRLFYINPSAKMHYQREIKWQGAFVALTFCCYICVACVCIWCVGKLKSERITVDWWHSHQ